MDQQRPTEFERAAAAGQKQTGFVGELIQFLRTNKKWWLLPILITFLLLALLILISSTGVAPFIYTLF